MLPIDPATMVYPAWLTNALAVASDVMLYVRLVWCAWAIRSLWRAVASHRRAIRREQARRNVARISRRAVSSPLRLMADRAAELQAISARGRIRTTRDLIGIQAIFLTVGVSSLFSPEPIRPQVTLFLVISVGMSMMAGWFAYDICDAIDAIDRQHARIVEEYRRRQRRLARARADAVTDTVVEDQ